jgi:hypothetical protein
MRRILCVITIMFGASCLVAQPARDTLVILNEVMYQPPTAAGTNAEYLELFNISFTDSVNLRRWRFGDANRQDTAEFPLGDIWLRPRSYAVIAGRGGFDSLLTIYNLPPDVLRLRLPTTTVGNGLGNGGDRILIRNAAGDTIQDYTYLNGAAPSGASIEKIIPSRVNASANWSAGTFNGTAGRRNSVTPFNFDLSVSAASSVRGRAGQSVSVPFTIRNRGTASFGAGTVARLFEGNNFSSPINSVTLTQNLLSNDSLAQTFSYIITANPPSFLTIALDNVQDENRLNDTARILVQPVSLRDTAIVLNEIMYDPPLGAESSDEFFEVFNSSTDSSINLRGWRVADSTSLLIAITDTLNGSGTMQLAPQSYAVIFNGSNPSRSFNYYRRLIPPAALILRTSTSFTFNNDADRLTLVNANGDTIARTRYTETSSNKGKSLEKIFTTRNDSSSNFAPSVDTLGTPGARNSVTPFPLDLSVSTVDTLRAALGETALLRVVIRNRGLQPLGNGKSVRLFDARNLAAPLSTLTLPQNLNRGDSLVQSFSISIAPGTLPQFIVALDNTNDQNPRNDTARVVLQLISRSDTAIVLNEIMYDPPEGVESSAGEFVELVNTGRDSIDLRNWRITDGSSFVTLADSGAGETRLAPQHYAVILGRNYFDSTRFYQSQIPTGVLVLKASASLGLTNTSDRVILLNPRSDTIASFTYTGVSGDKGFSLEKILPVRPNGITNFARSFFQGGSPGRANSVTVAVTAAPRSVVVNEILYQPIQDPNDGRPDQPDFIEIVNRSSDTLNVAGWSLSTLPNERGEFEQYYFATDAAQNYRLAPNELAVISPDLFGIRDTSRLVRFYDYLSGTPDKLFFVKGRSTFSNSVDGGLVKLRDGKGNTVDSVRYSPKWHSPFFPNPRGISLEKINPAFESNDAKSWTSSTDKKYLGTPAKRNSAFASNLSANPSSVSVSPNPFSPDGDGREDNCVIAYALPNTVNRIRIKIFDVKGRLVRTLANSEPSGSSGQIVWDGFGDNREKLRIGIYIILLEALDANNAAVAQLKKTVVLARPL